jgi:PHD/YefM family antitoxin component YafN of YafNO toxin-antitoxin module
MVTRLLPKTELRDRIREELATLGQDSLLITERGRPLAVIVGVERWNEIQETLEDLEDSVAILESRLEGRRGLPAESVFEAIEAEEADAPDPARKTG